MAIALNWNIKKAPLFYLQAAYTVFQHEYMQY